MLRSAPLCVTLGPSRGEREGSSSPPVPSCRCLGMCLFPERACTQRFRTPLSLLRIVKTWFSREGALLHTAGRFFVAWFLCFPEVSNVERKISLEPKGHRLTIRLPSALACTHVFVSVFCWEDTFTQIYFGPIQEKTPVIGLIELGFQASVGAALTQALLNSYSIEGRKRAKCR